MKLGRWAIAQEWLTLGLFLLLPCAYSGACAFDSLAAAQPLFTTGSQETRARALTSAYQNVLGLMHAAASTPRTALLFHGDAGVRFQERARASASFREALEHLEGLVETLDEATQGRVRGELRDRFERVEEASVEPQTASVRAPRWSRFEPLHSYQITGAGPEFQKKNLIYETAYLSGGEIVALTKDYHLVFVDALGKGETLAIIPTGRGSRWHSDPVALANGNVAYAAGHSEDVGRVWEFSPQGNILHTHELPPETSAASLLPLPSEGFVVTSQTKRMKSVHAVTAAAKELRPVVDLPVVAAEVTGGRSIPLADDRFVAFFSTGDRHQIFYSLAGELAISRHLPKGILASIQDSRRVSVISEDLRLEHFDASGKRVGEGRAEHGGRMYPLANGGFLATTNGKNAAVLHPDGSLKHLLLDVPDISKVHQFPNGALFVRGDLNYRNSFYWFDPEGKLTCQRNGLLHGYGARATSHEKNLVLFPTEQGFNIFNARGETFLRIRDPRYARTHDMHLNAKNQILSVGSGGEILWGALHYGDE